jgi:ABC-2 type transport system ATP-binding protein
VDSVISVQNLVKKYGDFTAVDGISFEVKEGELFGFLGPNGAGKTTTISMLTTLLSITSGEVRVEDYDISDQRDQVRQNIGIIFQDPSLDTELTAYENLWFHGMLYGMDRDNLKKLIPQLIERVELTDFLYKPVKTFSGGMKRRLEIARGLIHTPKVLFLDEPTLGLDAQTREKIWSYINTLRHEHKITIFLTTHYLEETERCDRIAIIDHGKIVDLDTPANLKHKYQKDTIEQVFLSLTGRDIREAQISALEQKREHFKQGGGRRW